MDRSLGAYPPVVQPLALTRPRRSSSVSYTSSPYIDPLRTRSGFGRVIKFKRKGAFRPGITIGEAQANVRLSGTDSYTLQDLGVDLRGKIYVNLRVRLHATESPTNSSASVVAWLSPSQLRNSHRRIYWLRRYPIACQTSWSCCFTLPAGPSLI